MNVEVHMTTDIDLTRSLNYFYFTSSFIYIALAAHINFPFNAFMKIIPVLVLIIATFESCSKKNDGLALKAALIMSLLGDFILNVPIENSFIGGLLCFLLAHIFYIKQFYGKLIFNKINTSLLFIILSLVVIMLLIIKPYLGVLTIPVICYMLVISIMAITAFLAENSSLLLKVGVFLFLSSDGLLSISMFTPLDINLSKIILITYYLAQYCIVKSVIANKYLNIGYKNAFLS